MNIGFIGMGNMAQALVSGFVDYIGEKGGSVSAYAPNEKKLAQNASRLGFKAAKDLECLVHYSDIMILACKPYQVEQVLKEIGRFSAKSREKDKVLISIALGWNFEKWQTYAIDGVQFQFVMPNTPAMVGEGVFLFEEQTSVKESTRNILKEIFSAMGLVVELPSSLMGIGGAVSGCGPAFVDIFIEAYADVAVKYGIPRETAYKLVSSTVMGAAKLQLVTGEHPALLKDKVCSPAGSTIKGVTALEREGFRRACQTSIDDIMQK